MGIGGDWPGRARSTRLRRLLPLAAATALLGACSGGTSASTEPSVNEPPKEKPAAASAQPSPAAAETATESSSKTGVGCQDYMDCVCKMAERTRGLKTNTVDPDEQCRQAQAFRGSLKDSACNRLMDEFRVQLGGQEKALLPLGITLPAVCQ